MFQTLQGHHQGCIYEGLSTANSVKEVCVSVCVCEVFLHTASALKTLTKVLTEIQF